MAFYRRSHRARYTLLPLVLTAITLLTRDERAGTNKWFDKVKATTADAFAPVQWGTSKVVDPVGDFFDGVVHYGVLKQESARLRGQLQSQRAASLQAAESER